MDRDEQEDKQVDDQNETADHKEARLILAQAEKSLEDVGNDTAERARLMVHVAAAIGNYHAVSQPETITDLDRSLELCRTARSLVEENSYIRGTSCFTEMIVSRTYYYDTKDVKWLEKSIDAGKISVNWFIERENAFTSEDEQKFYRTGLSGRYSYLGQAYKLMYDATGEITWLRQARNWMADAADMTCCEAHIGANFTEYSHGRFLQFVHWTLLIMPYDSSIQMTSMVKLVMKRLEEAKSFVYYDFLLALSILARQWAISRSESDFGELVKQAKKYVELHKISDKYGQNPEDAQSALRAYAAHFQYEIETKYNDTFAKDLVSLNTEIALWEHILSNIEQKTLGDLRESMAPVVWLTDLYGVRYRLTESPSDAEAYDRMNMRNSAQGVAIKSASLDDTTLMSMSGTISVTIGPSILNGRMLICWPKQTADNWTRCLFLQDEGKPRPETWIREYRKDGTFGLGLLVEGKDDDVIEFISKYETEH